MFTKSKPGPAPYDAASGPGSGLGIPQPPQGEHRSPDAPRPELQRAPPPSAPRSTNLSTLSAGVKYEGNISGGGDIQIDGTLKGDVRVSRVLIGEGGVVEGTVTAELIEVRGRVSGGISAKTVKLFATARVEGDITQDQLSIEQGAWFQGRSIQAKRETVSQAAIEAPAAPVERYQPEKPVAPALPGIKSEKAEAKA